MATIEKRGPFQFRVKVRRNGVSETRTFESKREADEWARVMEGRITGDDYQDSRLAKKTTLADACDWFEKNLDKSKPDFRNKLSKLKYWRESDFHFWSIASIRPAHLIQWRRIVLDEDNADCGEVAGPEAEVGPQTVVHRLNVLAQVYQHWSLAHDQVVSCPVTKGVRPSLPDGRNRRLDPHSDEHGQDEEARLLAAAAKSSRPWLVAAIIIAIETSMRQAELAGLTWGRVNLSAQYPYCDLPMTKNGKPRRVPLSIRAVHAFQLLLPEGVAGALGKRAVLPVETGRGIAHAFRDAVSDEAFPDLRWHDLRHEAVSRLFELTDLRDTEIMAITGHLRPEMLARYTHLRSDRLGSRLPGGAMNPMGQFAGAP